MPVSTWVCALSFGRCRMSKFWLLVYFGFLGSLRPALAHMQFSCASTDDRRRTNDATCGPQEWLTGTPH